MAAVAIFGGLITVAAPPALAAPIGHACVVTDDTCVHRTTVASGSSARLAWTFHTGRTAASRWGIWTHADVFMHVAGSTGFERIHRLRRPFTGGSWHYSTDPLVGPAIYVFQMRSQRDVTDRAIVVVSAPTP